MTVEAERRKDEQMPNSDSSAKVGIIPRENFGNMSSTARPAHPALTART